MRYRGEGFGIVFVDDEARDLVVLIGNDVFGEERLQRYVRQRHLRGHALFVVSGGSACEIVSRSGGAGFRQQHP